MKKAVASISLFVYLLMSCGVIINSHYCMNKLDSTGFFSEAAEVCGKCGMHINDSSGCCRDEVKVIKLDDDHKVTVQNVFSLPTLEAIVSTPSEFIVAPFVNNNVPEEIWDHSPPLPDGRSLHIKNSVFRI